MTDSVLIKKYKIHLLSCHSVLEYDLLKLFTEIGLDVFSNGAYRDPKGNKLLPRPGVIEAPYYPEFEKLSAEFPKTNLPKELIDPFDIIFIMHTPEFVSENWSKIKHKKVIWYSIGQSTKGVENMIRRMRYDGMKLVRYSKMEQNLPDFIGVDAVIPFYKDENEFKGWTGSEKRVINFTQSLKGRGEFCHYNHIMKVFQGFPSLVYGSGNDDLGPMNGGDMPYDIMKGALRENRVFFYGGTWPAPYTLTLIEAMMTGIPVVSIGKKLAENIHGVAKDDVGNFFDIPNIITDEVNGYYSDDISILRGRIHRLLNDADLAKKIGDAGRVKAIELFGKNKAKDAWREFFNRL